MEARWRQGGCEVDVGGTGSHSLLLLVLDQFFIQSARFKHFTASGDSRRCRQFRWIVFKLTCRWTPPSLHVCPLDVMW